MIGTEDGLGVRYTFLPDRRVLRYIDISEDVKEMWNNTDREERTKEANKNRERTEITKVELKETGCKKYYPLGRTVKEIEKDRRERGFKVEQEEEQEEQVEQKRAAISGAEGAVIISKGGVDIAINPVETRETKGDEYVETRTIKVVNALFTTEEQKREEQIKNNYLLSWHDLKIRREQAIKSSKLLEDDLEIYKKYTKNRNNGLKAKKTREENIKKAIRAVQAINCASYSLGYKTIINPYKYRTKTTGKGKGGKPNTRIVNAIKRTEIISREERKLKKIIQKYPEDLRRVIKGLVSYNTRTVRTDKMLNAGEIRKYYRNIRDDIRGVRQAIIKNSNNVEKLAINLEKIHKKSKENKGGLIRLSNKDIVERINALKIRREGF